MGGDAPAGSSLLQAPADIVSSRHLKQKKHLHSHLHDQYRHTHIDLHRRQISVSATDITTTVQVIQQVVVDLSGSTIGVQTVVGNSWTTPSTSGNQPTLPPTFPLLTEILAPAEISSDYSLSSKSSYPQSLPTSQRATSTPSSSQQGLPLVLNSTSYPLGNASPSRSNNYTLPSTISSSISLSVSSSAVSLTTTSTETSSTSSFSSTDLYPSSEPAETLAETPTGVGNVISGTSTSAANAPTNSAGSGGDGSSTGPTPPTPILIGGLVGGLAGFAIIIMFLIFILRWKKRNSGALFLGRGKDSSTAPEATRGPGLLQSGPMGERSIPFSIPSSLASLTGYKRVSKERATAKSTSGNERGFYRVSGRKLRSVLQSGGDGWDGPDDNTLSGSSFYRDSHGFYGGPGGPPSPLRNDRGSGIPVMRPSPARTPVTSQGAFARPPSPPQVELPRRPDVLGRSLPSQDGSHGSRFHEDV